MITLEDCIAFCGLSEEVVLAIAAHEHIPEIVAAGLGSHLMSKEGGAGKIRDMIIDNIREAQDEGDEEHILSLLRVLHNFLDVHRDAIPSGRSLSAFM